MSNPITPVLLAIAIVLLAAKLGGALAVRLRQPAVLGELLVGVLLGNAALLGFRGFEFLRLPAADALATVEGRTAALPAISLDTLARLGVVILLFEVGLECKVSELWRVGRSAALAAALGVTASLALGWMAARWLLPQQAWQTHLFIAAALGATSVGITARVLKDMGSLNMPEAKIILGAAVVDDVLGLVVLSIVEGLILHAATGWGQVVWLVAKSAGFLIAALAIGRWCGLSLFRVVLLLRVHGMFIVSAFVFCFLLAWCASLAGLDPIVGAFAAGLILDHDGIKKLSPQGERSLEDLVFPISAMFVPIFFVMLGFAVDLRNFAGLNVLALTAGLTMAAVLGKQACSLGVLERGARRRLVGFGMIPRGEVTLIFATVGAGLVVAGQPVIDPPVYAALFAVVVLTTLLTPPLLIAAIHGKGRNG
jgi:Kef-type K+ transport system membrane component KefB